MSLALSLVRRFGAIAASCAVALSLGIASDARAQGGPPDQDRGADSPQAALAAFVEGWQKADVAAVARVLPYRARQDWFRLAMAKVYVNGAKLLSAKPGELAMDGSDKASVKVEWSVEADPAALEKEIAALLLIALDKEVEDGKVSEADAATRRGAIAAAVGGMGPGMETKLEAKEIVLHFNKSEQGKWFLAFPPAWLGQEKAEDVAPPAGEGK